MNYDIRNKIRSVLDIVNLKKYRGFQETPRKEVKFYMNPSIPDGFAFWYGKFLYFSMAAKGSQALKILEKLILKINTCNYM